jgi:adenine-specific DNA-methyltransferase
VSSPGALLWQGDVLQFLHSLPEEELFDLVVTSPPYNLRKPYEPHRELEEYVSWQKSIIEPIVTRLKPTGSLCWQVGNYLEKRKGGRSSSVLPLDLVFHPIFQSLGLKLRNRIVWHFGHGLHCKYRFSGRYEVVLWYTKSDEYLFNLDEVRVPPKYPSKRHFKGPNAGVYSCNPKGKNPEDVWDIPNVKGNHIEKTRHPCQFPVALAERLILALSDPGGLVFDPFAGVGSAGVAALIRGRRFWGCELDETYLHIARSRLDDALAGKARYRPLSRPIYDHTQSPLSRRPGS